MEHDEQSLSADAAHVLPELDETGQPEAEESRLLHFRPWLTAEGEKLKALCEEVFAAIPPPAITPGRKPRADAIERRKLCTVSLLANLVLLGLSRVRYEALLLSVRRDAKNRYTKAAFTAEVLRECLTALNFLEVVSIKWGRAHQAATRLTISEGFRRRLEADGITPADVGKLPGAETILLRTRGERSGITGDLVDYPETDLTRAMRREVEELNASLCSADIRLDGRPLGPIHMVRIFQHHPEKPWAMHGRLYWGPHSNLEKSERYRLSIAGEELCDLDWSSCHLRIAYASTGIEPPSGDLYAIPGLEEHRAGVKNAFNALFNRRPTETGQAFIPRLPRGTRLKMPAGWTGKLFLEAARQFHPAIAHLFGKPDVGLEFMKLEADMMLETLRRLREVGCVGLPLHDGLMCGKQYREEAIKVMQEVSQVFLGWATPVTEKAIWRPDTNNSPLMAYGDGL
ncbi:hypothetical protein [Rhizobium leguminosarum]